MSQCSDEEHSIDRSNVESLLKVGQSEELTQASCVSMCTVKEQVKSNSVGMYLSFMIKQDMHLHVSEKGHNSNIRMCIKPP